VRSPERGSFKRKVECTDYERSAHGDQAKTAIAEVAVRLKFKSQKGESLDSPF